MPQQDDPPRPKVVNGEITPNAAARQQGWCKPRIVASNSTVTSTDVQVCALTDKPLALQYRPPTGGPTTARPSAPVSHSLCRQQPPPHH
jgi:hypothetical protein